MFRAWLSGAIKKNKSKIWLVLKVVAFGIIAIYFFIYFFNDLEQSNVEEKNISTVYKPTKTIISGSDVPEEKYEEDNNIINTFIEYCNKKDTAKAYKMLTDECKNIMYQTEQDFITKYYNVIFNNKERQYNLQSWVKDGDYITYKIRIIDDVLSSGSYDYSEQYEDYITIVSKDDEQKININGFIKKEKLDEKNKKEDIEISSIEKEVYMNYEICTLEVTNNTGNDILLDSLENPNKNTILVTNDGKEYGVQTIDISTLLAKVKAKQTKKIRLKFNKNYSSDEGAKIKFLDVIMNYKQYLKNKEDINRYNISVSL